MADNVAISPGAGVSIATDDIGGVQYQRVKLTFGVDGTATDVSASNPAPVTGPLTDTELRASAVPVSAASLPLPTGAATQATLAEIKTQGDTAIALVTGYTGINVAGQPVTESNALPVKDAQGTVEFDEITAVAATAGTLMVAAAGRYGARILNYLSSPIYIVKGSAGTPASGSGSDFVPAAYNGEPGQYTFDYRPVDDYRYVTAASGNFTVITW
jgi:hypothetical protein